MCIRDQASAFFLLSLAINLSGFLFGEGKKENDVSAGRKDDEDDPDCSFRVTCFLELH